MLVWLEKALSGIGSGVVGVVKWLFGGLEIILTKIVTALDTFWDVLDAVWDFAVGMIGSIMRLLGIFFPFLPAEVTTVISLALLTSAIAGLCKWVRR